MDSLHSSSLISRAQELLQRHGVKGSIVKTLQIAQKRMYLDETHVWYELDLRGNRPHIPLLSQLTLVKGGFPELQLLNELPTVSMYTARRRLAAGNDVWLVLKDQYPVFACWVFHHSVPLLAARNGQLTLPPEIVCFEDSVSSLSYRGRGVAFGAWSQIAEDLERAQVKSIITKVEEANTAARRAFTKVGFQEIAVTRFCRVGPRASVSIQPKSGVAIDWLVEQLRT